MPLVSPSNKVQPIKLKSRTNNSALYPSVIRIESFRASRAVTFGLLASIYGAIEYAYALIMPGTMNRHIHNDIQSDIHRVPPNLRPKLTFSVENGSVALILCP